MEEELYKLIDQNQLPGFSNVSNNLFRRLYLQGLGAFSQSFAGRELFAGNMAMCITEGRVLDFSFDFDATFSMSSKDGLALTTEVTSHKGITSKGSVFDQDVPSFQILTKFSEEPDDLKELLTKTFRLPIVPELSEPIKNNPEISEKDLNECWLEFFGPGLGSGMYALSLLKESDYETRIEVNDPDNQILIKTWVSFLPLR